MPEKQYKIITQPEKFIMVSKKEKEEELAKLKVSLANLTITEAEVDVWRVEELEKRTQIYVQRIQETEDILDKIKGL